MKRRQWSWDELREWTIQHEFKDYDEKAVFLNVLWKGEFYDITLIQKKADCTMSEEARPSYAIVFTQNEFICGDHYMRVASHYQATPKVLKVVSKDEGNRIFKSIKATRKTTKNNKVMYRFNGDFT